MSQDPQEVIGAEVIATRTSGKATTSFVLGILSLCLSLIAGVPAIVLGILGLSDIERSGGRLTGRGLAISGIVLGGLSVFAIPMIAILVALLLPAVNAAREAARSTMCMNNQKQIAIALLSYHANFGSFPPAVTLDAEGRPMHSWRALILPYLDAPEGKALAGLYHWDEPWDGPNNHPLAGRMPAVFQCASEDSNLSEGETSYVAVVGDDTAWPGIRATTERDIRDGPSNTILVAEAHGLHINWLEPRDLDRDSYVARVVGEAGPMPHATATVAVFCDGSVHRLSSDTPREVVEGMLTIAGGEPAAPD